MRNILITFFLVPLFSVVNAQEQLIVDSIYVSGNKKTKTGIVLRELDLQVGDTIFTSNINEIIEQNRLLLVSTGLFSKVVFATENNNSHLTIYIQLEEAWYLYPYLNISFGDRNFNVWRQNDFALNRLNYTFQVVHRNLTGRRDFLKSYLQIGYEPKFQTTYELPYFNQNKTLGFRGDIFYAQAKEWGLSTNADTLSLISNQDAVIIRRLRVTAGLRYQQGVFTRHEIELRFHRHHISEFAAAYNPDFFLDGNTLQRYLALRYQFTADYRDFKPYPEQGYFLSTVIQKEGFGIFKDLNNLTIEPRFAYYQPLGKRLSFELNLQGKTSLIRTEQPYFNFRSLGYRPNNMRGYEYYVIDGLDYVLQQAILRYQWLGKDLGINKKNPDKTRQSFPIKIYSTIFQDNAYVNNPFYSNGNDFTNRHLWSFGTGLDFVIYNDFVLKFEYTWNHTFENDLYIHFALPF